MGEGIFGIEAAARHYFGKGADALTAREAAALAVVLPSPLRYHPVEGGRYVESRTEAVYRIMVRRGIVIPEYEEMLNEPAGNGQPPMQSTGDAANPGAAGAPGGADGTDGRDIGMETPPVGGAEGEKSATDPCGYQEITVWMKSSAPTRTRMMWMYRSKRPCGMVRLRRFPIQIDNRSSGRERRKYQPTDGVQSPPSP